MSRNFSFARVEQHTRASIGKTERHIERKNETYENMNVDLSRTPMNIHFKSCGDLTYNAHLDKLVSEGTVSLRGLKKDAKLFDEMIFDVNSAYFEEHGGYEFARRFYEAAYRFALQEYGEQNILSAVMHADELNTALTEKLGHPVYHYHLHVVALPVVEKQVLWSKRCKDPALRGTVKAVIQQVSHSKKWASQRVTDETGTERLIKSYSLLQDRFFRYMRDAGFEDFERGERGSTAEHLSVLEYKTKKESERLSELEAQAERQEAQLQKLTAKTKTQKAIAATFADIEGMGKKTLLGKIEMSQQEARDLKDLAKKGVTADARVSDMKRKLQSAKRDAERWRNSYNSLLEQTRDFLAAVKRAPELVRRFIDQVLSLEQEPIRRPSRRRDHSMER